MTISQMCLDVIAHKLNVLHHVLCAAGRSWKTLACVPWSRPCLPVSGTPITLTAMLRCWTTLQFPQAFLPSWMHTMLCTSTQSLQTSCQIMTPPLLGSTVSRNGWEQHAGFEGALCIVYALAKSCHFYVGSCCHVDPSVHAMSLFLYTFTRLS